MQKSKKLKGADVLAKAALVASKHSANSRCAAVYHQPEVPESLKKLRKY